MIQTLLLISRWIGQAHDQWRSNTASRRPKAAEIDLLHEQIEQLQSENKILRTRLLRLPPRKRPRFKPWQRLQILIHASRYALSTRATSRAFLVTVQTLTNWRKDAARGLKELVQTRKPMNQLPDLVEQIARYFKAEWPAWGSRRIAGILARLGLKASRTSVQRILRRPQLPPPARKARARRGPLRARRPGHVWIVDFTTEDSFQVRCRGRSDRRLFSKGPGSSSVFRRARCSLCVPARGRSHRTKRKASLGRLRPWHAVQSKAVQAIPPQAQDLPPVRTSRRREPGQDRSVLENAERRVRVRALPLPAYSDP